MSVEIIKQVVNHTHEKQSSALSYISDCDIIVPDYKPDMINILKVSAKEQIDEKSISKDYVTVSGKIDYSILYITDDSDKPIDNINYTTPFTKQIPIEGSDEECSCIVKSSVVHTEHNIHNSRKLNVKCAVDMSACVFQKSSSEIVTNVSDQSVMPFKKNTVTCCNVCEVKEHIFTVEEFCQINDSGHCSEVVDHCVSIVNSDVKVVANKVIIKGDMLVKTLYLSDMDLKQTESEIPFTQIVDIDTNDGDVIPVAEYMIKNTSVSCELDTDATMSQLKVTAQICAVVKLFAQSSIDYISDAYSPDFETDVIRSQIVITGIEDTVNSQCIVNERLKTESTDSIQKVLALDTSAHVEQTEIISDSIRVTGFVNASVIFRGQTDTVSSLDTKIPFECDVKMNTPCKSKNVKCICSVSDHNASYNIDGTDTINIREVIKLSCNLISENCVDVVNDIEFDENKKTDKSTQAGITVYFVQNGDNMWDIAKRYNTTGEEIITVNKLENDFELACGQQLIIPKHN